MIHWKTYIVLNLVINGLPSILKYKDIVAIGDKLVLNLVINGLPSIQYFTRLLITSLNLI